MQVLDWESIKNWDWVSIIFFNRMTFTQKIFLSIFCTPEKDVCCSYGAGFEHAPSFFISGGKAFTGNI